MKAPLGRGLALLAVAGGVASGALGAAENEAAPVAVVRIGMVSTLFRDTPESLVTAMMQPFGALMEAQTGLPGKLIPGGDAVHLGKLLTEDQVHLGVFHGVEFGWARQKYAELRPLMIAVNQQRNLHAMVVVRADAGVEDWSQLAGKTLALPARSREHCRLFLERRCRAPGGSPQDFFGRITHPSSCEEAIDDVVDNVVQAAVVDAIGVDSYRRRKPGRFAKLKVLERSETFPAAVVAYHPGALDEATLRRFREGMLNAGNAALGRQFMTLWKLTAFEPIPADYDQLLTSIVKTYPPPAAGE